MRRGLVVLVGSLVACRPEPTRAPVDVPMARAERGSVALSACEAVLDEGRQALEAWRRRQRAPLPDSVWDDLDSFNQCVERAGGVWATVLGPPMGDARAPGLAGRFKLVFVGGDGTRSEAWPSVGDGDDGFVLRAGESAWRQGEDLRTRLGPLQLFDYDGDGAPELLATVNEQPSEGETIARVIVWRATATRLEPFEPAMGLHPVGVEDFDGDGRPDLRTHAELLTVDDAHPGRFLRGPALYARSLPGGGFTLSSGEALRRNRALCPAPSGLPGWVRDGDDIDVRATVERLACAVSWHVSPVALDAALRRGCPQPSDGGASPCAQRLMALVALAHTPSLADLRAAVSFEARGARGTLRPWYAVLEGLDRTVAPIELGTMAGECDLIDGEGRAGEVALLQCWAGAEGMEVRALRLGAVLVLQRRRVHDGGPAGPYAEIRRVMVPATLPLRAGSLLEGE